MKLRFGVVLAVAACGSSEPMTYSFGPFPIAPGDERVDTCVSVTLDNAEPIYVNAVELSAGPGLHHSNWFWVPRHLFAGEDGVWSCKDRDYSEGVAGVLGGVLFAQSTQASHELQSFPDGVVIKIPPHSKIVAGVHLQNPTDADLDVPLGVALSPIEERDVTTVLAGMSFENESILLPPYRTSRFTVECDLGPRHQALLGRAPDFHIYYALPHYHELGTGLTFEALGDDGTSDMIWETTHRIGDAIGGMLPVPFGMAGRSRFRFSCTYTNPRDVAVRWGNGDQEMCIFLAFTDSPYTWGGGVLSRDDPGPGVEHDGLVEFTAPACVVLANDASH